MRTEVVAVCFAIAALALPVAAQAQSVAKEPCGVPQGYGTSNPYTANRSTCGLAGQASSMQSPPSNSGSGIQRPVGYGTANPYIPNSGAPNLGSNTDGM